MTRETLINRWLDTAAHGNVNAMKTLLNRDQTLLEATNSGPEDAIFYTVGNNHIGATQFLIDCNVNLLKIYTFGEKLLTISESPQMKRLIASATFHKTIENNMISLINLFLESPHLDINYQDKNGETALIKMLKRENCTARQVQQLLDNGADVSIVSERGDTALNLTLDDEILAILLENAQQTATQSLGNSQDMSLDSQNDERNRPRSLSF